MSSVSSSSKPAGGWQPPTLEEMQAMLPQYQFEALLGRGGMGAVYKALQVTLDRKVAIKVLPVDLVEDGDAQFAERFKNEARTMAKMNHPSIVKVFDFGETNTGLLYIVMEFIDGTDVAQMIAAQGKLPEDYALSITAHVSDALAYAHKNGIIHRDIKPANILINMEGAVKVADFGLAKANDPGQSGITKTNMAMGTPDFVAPEAFIPGIPLDGRADLYAMGVMLYQMLTGEIPRGIWTLPGKKLGTDPRFDAIIMKAMQTDREVRYQTAAEIRQELDVIMTTPRAVLIQQQQAAAEAAARATQAQKQAASGPQRRMPEQPAHHAPPPVKKSSLGPVIGIAATIVLVAGLVYVLKPPAKKPVRQTTASTSDNKPPAPVPKSAPVLTPAPNGSAGFSSFVPTAQWRDEMAGTDSWGPAWQRADGEMHVVASMNGMRLFADLRRDSALRVRFRARRDDASLNLIQRLNKVGIGPRYLVTIRTKANIDGSLDMLPMKKDGDKRTLAPLKSNPPLGTGTEHTAEFYAIGKRLAFFFDGQLLSEAPESTLTEGFPGVFASHGIELIVVETAVLDKPTSNPPPVEVLAFGGHRYQFSPEKLNWEEAKAKAATTGGHLATITSQEENQWVLDTFVSKLPGGLSLWLGGTNDNPTRQWTWITGEPFTFTAWGAGEPGTNPNEPVLCFSQMNMGWGDIRTNGIGNADRRGGYLIEWDDASTKPMPASPAPVASTSTVPAANPGTPPGWMDLMATADVARDATEGQWAMTKDGLHCEADGRMNYFKLNPTPPEEYDFEIEFTVGKGGIHGTVSQIIVVPGHRFALHMSSKFSSLGANLDGKRWDDPERTEALSREIGFKPGQRTRAKVEIRRGRARVLLDDQEVINWSGDFKRLGLHTPSYNQRDTTQLAVACQNAEVVFHRIRVASSPMPTAVMTPALATPATNTPAAKPPIPPAWTDLLADVDVQRDTVSGKWEMTPDGLILKRERGVKVLEFNHSPPEEYDFEIEFTISEGSDVSQVLSVAGHPLRWKMAQGSPPTNFCSFGPMLDGLSPDDPKRTEAVLKRERLKTGQRYRSTVEVRRGSLRALIDGEEVLQWSGNLERLGDEKSTSVKNGKHLGLACYATGVTFHSAVVRPAAGGPSVPSPAMPVVASAPTTGGASATGNTPKSEPPAPPSDPHLAKLEAGFTARFQSDVQKPFLDAVAALNKSYLANGVAKARAAAQSRGSLKEVVAFDEVKARIERGEGVPEVDEPGTPESLKSLRTIYRNALGKITAERDARAAPLYDIYVNALDTYITELIKATKLDEARQVKELRSKIAAQKPAATVVAEAPEPAPPPPPSTGGTPSPSTTAKPLSSGSSWRTAADFLVANGGSFVAAKNGGTTNVSTPEEIPSGRFDILELTLNRDGSVLPPLKDADFAAFSGLRDLRRVHIRPSKPGLNDAAFAFLSSNSDLTWVNLDGVPDVTDAVLVHLAGARKLDYLSIQNAPQVTGRGLDRLSCTTSLTTLELMGSGLTDDGMRALAAFKKLQTLHVNSKSVTNAGVAALANVSSLSALNLTGTALGDESAESLAKLTRLTSLDLSSTQITDLGLKKLLLLKRLTSLRLNSTAVTLEAAAEFQKQMPQCKVSR